MAMTGRRPFFRPHLAFSSETPRGSSPAANGPPSSSTEADDRSLTGEQARQFREVVLPHLDGAYNLARYLARDPTAAEEVLATITRLVHDLGVTVVIAEHRLERVVQYADRIVHLPGDGTVEHGEPVTHATGRAGQVHHDRAAGDAGHTFSTLIERTVG